MNLNNRILQARIDQYAFGVWFDTTDIDPYAQTVTIYNHLLDGEATFSDEDKTIMYREVAAPE